MSQRRAPKPKKGKPFEQRDRMARKSHEERLKEMSKKLEHDKELEVALERVSRLGEKELVARQTKYLTAMVKAGKSQQAFLHVANMSPEEFRDFAIQKLLHHHS